MIFKNQKVYKYKLEIFLFGDLMLKSFPRNQQIKRCWKTCIIKLGELILRNSLSYAPIWNGKKYFWHVFNFVDINVLKLLQSIKLECLKFYLTFTLNYFVFRWCISQGSPENQQDRHR